MPTFKRYYLYGRRGVRLQTALIGGKRVTTRQWIDEFIAGVTATDDIPQPEFLSSRDYAQQQEQISAARERLRAAGILNAQEEQQ